MATMFARHKVRDYGNWKSIYDEFAAARKENNVTAASIHRDPNESDVIIVVHQFTDMDAARAFANSEELKSTMEKAGVIGAPEIWFGEDIESTPY